VRKEDRRLNRKTRRTFAKNIRRTLKEHIAAMAGKSQHKIFGMEVALYTPREFPLQKWWPSIQALLR